MNPALVDDISAGRCKQGTFAFSHSFSFGNRNLTLNFKLASDSVRGVFSRNQT